MNFIKLVAYLYTLIKTSIHFLLVEYADGEKTPQLSSDNSYIANTIFIMNKVVLV